MCNFQVFFLRGKYIYRKHMPLNYKASPRYKSLKPRAIFSLVTCQRWAQPFSTVMLGRLIMLCSVTCLLIASLINCPWFICLLSVTTTSLLDRIALNHSSQPDTISRRIFHNLTNQTTIYDWTNPQTSPEIFLFFPPSFLSTVLPDTCDKWITLGNYFVVRNDYQRTGFTLWFTTRYTGVGVCLLFYCGILDRL